MTEGYSTKELHAMLDPIRKDIAELSRDLAVTRESLRQYNEMREELAETASEVNKLKVLKDREGDVTESVQRWGGWGVALATLGWMMFQSLA